MTETALVLSRGLHFAAAMLLWGGLCLFRGEPRPVGFDRTARRLAALNLAGALAWFAAECALAGDGPGDALNPAVMAAMLGDTRFGMVWGPHMVLAAVLAVLALRPRGGRLVLLLAGLNLGSIGLTGHAVLPGGLPGLVHQALAVVHLLAGGYWIGALPFVLALLQAPDRTRRLMRFSRDGHWAVAAVILTGLARTVLIQTARAPLDPAPVWSLLLAAKGVAVLAMAALALDNRYRLVPRGPAGLPALERATRAEIWLSAAVLILASLFPTLSPFGHDG